MRFLNRIVVLPGILVLLLFFPSNHAQQFTTTAVVAPQYEYDTNSFQTGDIIFRRGLGPASDFIVSADRGSLFSHVGLIYKAQEEIFVIHILPSEVHSNEEHDAKIESIDDFLSQSSAVAIYRLKISNGEPKNATDVALDYVDSNIGFDFNFDLATKNKMYCTEFVWNSYLNAGVDLVNGKFDELQMPFLKGQFILPSTLLNSPQLMLVQTLKMKGIHYED